MNLTTKQFWVITGGVIAILVAIAIVILSALILVRLDSRRDEQNVAIQENLKEEKYLFVEGGSLFACSNPKELHSIAILLAGEMEGAQLRAKQAKEYMEIAVGSHRCEIIQSPVRVVKMDLLGAAPMDYGNGKAAMLFGLIIAQERGSFFSSILRVDGKNFDFFRLTTTILLGVNMSPEKNM